MGIYNEINRKRENSLSVELLNEKHSTEASYTRFHLRSGRIVLGMPPSLWTSIKMAVEADGEKAVKGIVK
jgi:hypothetical protein